jgi:hypothetical protein
MAFHIPDLYRRQVRVLAFCHGCEMLDARAEDYMIAYGFIDGSWITRAPENEHYFVSADDKNIPDGRTPPNSVSDDVADRVA